MTDETAAGPETEVGAETATDSGVRQPQLVVDEERTPLPEVDRAMPILMLFPAVLGYGERGRYRVALLKTLAGSGAGRWKIREIHDAAWWLEPGSATELVQELAHGGVLDYNAQHRIYTMPPASRVAVAFIDAITFPGATPQRIVRFFSAAIEMAAQAGPEAAVNSFAQAVAVLRADVDELRRLMEDGALESLLEAAEKISFDADDMDTLLDRHESFRLERSDDPRFRELEADAFRLSAQLHKVTAEVIEQLTGRANEVMLGGARIDRADIRDFIEQTSRRQLAALLRGLALPPPFVPSLSASAAFEQLLVKMGLERHEPPPLPVAAAIEVLPLVETADPTTELTEELKALTRPATLHELTVRETWPASVGRHTALVDAYDRDTRTGELPAIEFEEGIECFEEGPVACISRATVHPRLRVVHEEAPTR